MVLVVLYMSVLIFLIYKLGWKLPAGNLISVSIYVIGLMTIVVSGAVDYAGRVDRSGQEITNREAWEIYYMCFKGFSRQIMNWCYLLLLILIYYYILQLKQFWDEMFFEKVSYIYNTNFVFSSN